MHFYTIVLVSTILLFEPFAVESLIRCKPCDEISCGEAICAPNQVLKPKANCGCCDVCFTKVGENGICKPPGIGGPLYPYECEDNLTCTASGEDFEAWICKK